jgi:glycosyltransferase involved in cell wall biosynthesis
MKRSSVLLAPFTKPLNDYPFYYSPFKILEALSCALPVVTNDFDNLQELLDSPWCGQTISSPDPNSWAEALKSILGVEKPSEKLGRDYQMRHTWTDHVSKILETFFDYFLL